jgi:hypothetical protein
VVDDDMVTVLLDVVVSVLRGEWLEVTEVVVVRVVVKECDDETEGDHDDVEVMDDEAPVEIDELGVGVDVDVDESVELDERLLVPVGVLD